MKIKLVAFQVGRSKPTSNRSFDYPVKTRGKRPDYATPQMQLAAAVAALFVSKRADFISIRRVEDE